jgi:acetyltransferase-like isoleucine patch superfamily enzyme
MGLSLYDDEYIMRGLKGSYQVEDELHATFADRIGVAVLKSGMAICYVLICIICKVPILSSLYETFARSYSRGSVGFFLRGAYYKNRLKSMGKNVFIDVGVTIWQPGNVEIDDYSFVDTYVTILGGRKGHGYVKIGKYVEVASNCVLAGRGGIKLGDHVGLGAGSKIYSGTHLYKDPDREDTELMSGSILAPMDKQYVVEKPVIFEDYAWMGVNSAAIPGVTIGKGAIIGAGSVVNSDIPAFSVAVGSPAKVIKKRPLSENKSQ